MTSLKRSILATLTYSDHFKYPLSASELSLRLVNHKLNKKTLLTSSLSSLVKSGKISKSGIYYHLPNKESLLKLRKIRSAKAKEKRNQIKPLIPKLSNISGVVAIYLTGSLAAGSSKKGDDIDLMIITSPGRLWTTRLLLTLYTQARGLRRRPGEKVASDKLCLNLYLTTSSLEVPGSLHSLYTAYELIQAVPIFDKKDTHPQLMLANSWIKEYLPNVPLPKKSLKKNLATRPSMPAVILEFLLYHAQLAYMKNKITREHISSSSAFFHPHNPAKRVLDKLVL